MICIYGREKDAFSNPQQSALRYLWNVLNQFNDNKNHSGKQKTISRFTFSNWIRINELVRELPLFFPIICHLLQANLLFINQLNMKINAHFRFRHIHGYTHWKTYLSICVHRESRLHSERKPPNLTRFHCHEWRTTIKFDSITFCLLLLK